MLNKLTFIYRQHFKFIIAVNLGTSLFFSFLFLSKGYTHYPLYMLSIIFKLVGYLISIAVERLLYASRVYHYQNLGFSYKLIFSRLFIADFLLFILLISTGYLCANFI